MKRIEHMAMLGLFIAFIGFAALYPPSHAMTDTTSLKTMSGDIERHLNGLQLKGCKTNGFRFPTDDDIETWRASLEALLAGQYQTAASEADLVGYDVIEYVDSKRDKTYYILEERNNGDGLGTYVYYPGGSRLLNIQAPHPLYDSNTKAQSIAIFLESNAAAYALPGTHRCANCNETAYCTGTTTVCNSCCGLTGKQPYRNSDMAHNVQNFFQPAHEEIATHVDGIVSVSIHGFKKENPGDVDVIVSNGTAGDRSSSLATDVTDEYNEIFAEEKAGLKAGSCQQAGGPGDPCGGSNVQGRFVNGSTDLCKQGVSTVSGAERFIHIEQEPVLRAKPAAGKPGWQMTIDALEGVFPSLPRGYLSQQEADALNEASDEFGRTVAAGDFNGDGRDDLAVGVPKEDDQATDDGMVIVLYGGNAADGPGFERFGQSSAGALSESWDRFGSALAVGDFNGDGKDDLAVGVPSEDDRATDDGMVIIFYGSTSGLIPANYERIGQTDAGEQSETGDQFGSTLAAGDFNGDGKDDLAVGIPAENDKATDDGMAIVFYGSTSGLIPANCERIGQTDAGALSETGDRFAAALTAGDFNGDGKDDLAAGIPTENDRATDDGMVIVFYGSANGLLPANYNRIGQASVGTPSESGDTFGEALAAGDFDDDGKDDLAVGVPQENDRGTDDGMVIVFYGSIGGLSSARYHVFGQTSAGANSETQDYFGDSLTAGDFTGDGKDDLAVGVPGEDDDATNQGMVIVFYGGTSGLLPASYDRLLQKRVGGINEWGDQFGSSLASGDFNGDGKHDLAIGTPYEDIAGVGNAGAVYVDEGASGGIVKGMAGESR